MHHLHAPPTDRHLALQELRFDIPQDQLDCSMELASLLHVHVWLAVLFILRLMFTMHVSSLLLILSFRFRSPLFDIAIWLLPFFLVIIFAAGHVFLTLLVSCSFVYLASSIVLVLSYVEPSLILLWTQWTLIYRYLSLILFSTWTLCKTDLIWLSCASFSYSFVSIDLRTLELVVILSDCHHEILVIVSHSSHWVQYS